MAENMIETMTTAEVLKYLGISRQTLYRRIDEGVITPLPTLGALRKSPGLKFRREDVERLKRGEGL